MPTHVSRIARMFAVCGLMFWIIGQSATSQPMPVRGEMQLTYENGYLFAKSGDNWMALDLAASTTVITREIVPAGTAINRESGRAAAIAESPHYAISGAGITLQGAIGVAELPMLEIGGISFDKARVRVTETLPSVGGRRLAGIIGTDLLTRADVIVLDYRNRAAGMPTLTMKSRAAAARGMVEVPMTMRNGVPVVQADVNDTRIDLLLDTASPESFISPVALRAAGLTARPGSARTVSTIDGSTLRASTTMPVTVKLGARDLTGVLFTIGALPVFEPFGTDRRPALLGNGALEALRQIEIDFHAGVLRVPS